MKPFFYQRSRLSMDEETPTTENTTPTPTDNSEHIYLDVIHIASRPSSTKSLCPATKESTMEKTTSKPKEKKPKSRNLSSFLLMATVMFLSAICCVLGALYVIERSHTAMLASENSGKVRTTPSTNCTTTVAPTDGSLNCAVMKSELEKRKTVYKNRCSMNRASEVERGDSQDHKTTPIKTTPIKTTPIKTTPIKTTPITKCTIESMQFQSSSDTVKSRGAVAMASATVCFWCKSSPGVLHYVAYIEPNHGPGFEIVEEKSSSGSIDINWHSFCRTWSAGEERYMFYKDGKLQRKRESEREKRMTGGGTWVLGLRPDTPGGEPSVSETKWCGEITAVNVWNRVLRKRELGEMMGSCASTYKGNVKSWENFKSGVKRNVKLVKSTCCNT